MQKDENEAEVIIGFALASESAVATTLGKKHRIAADKIRRTLQWFLEKNEWRHVFDACARSSHDNAATSQLTSPSKKKRILRATTKIFGR